MYKKVIGYTAVLAAIILMYVATIFLAGTFFTFIPFLAIEVDSFFSLFFFSIFIVLYVVIAEIVNIFVRVFDSFGIDWLSKIFSKNETGIYIHGGLSFIYIYIVEMNYEGVRIPVFSLVLLHLCLMLGVYFFFRRKINDDIESDDMETERHEMNK
ncbi:hypothetical protein NSQ26_14080 [Bacillus sp. FSL W7-1360]